jgi:hypothetical protein
MSSSRKSFLQCTLCSCVFHTHSLEYHLDTWHRVTVEDSRRSLVSQMLEEEAETSSSADSDTSRKTEEEDKLSKSRVKVRESANSSMLLSTTSDSLLAGEESAGTAMDEQEEAPDTGTDSFIQQDSNWEEPHEVMHLSDCHYWVDTAPLPLLEDEELKDYKPPSHVSFSAAPIRQFFTHSAEDYDRRNLSVNPAVSCAEYELEKRLEVEVATDCNVPGGGGQGGGAGTLGPEDGDRSRPGSGEARDRRHESRDLVAERDCRNRVDDQIVEVTGGTQAFVASKLQSVTRRVESPSSWGEDSPEVSEEARVVRKRVSHSTEMEE